MRTATFLISLVCVGCSTAPRTAPESQPLTAIDPLEQFVGSLEKEPNARVFVDRIELDGTAPPELVVEERCAPGKCSFEGVLASPDDVGPALVRYRIYDVSEPQAPRLLHDRPIVATHFASLHVAEFDGLAPREVVVRSSRIPADRSADEVYVYRTLSLRDSEWSVTEEPPCAATMPKYQTMYPLFADVDGDGRSDWIQLEVITDRDDRFSLEYSKMFVCDASGDAPAWTAVEDTDVPEKVREALRRALADESTGNDEILALVALLRHLDQPPEASAKLVELLTRLYDHSADYDEPLAAPSLYTQFDRSQVAHCPEDELPSCAATTVTALVNERGQARTIRELVLLGSIRWLLDDPQASPTVAEWAKQRIERSPHPSEMYPLVSLANDAMPPAERKEWAERTARRELGVLSSAQSKDSDVEKAIAIVTGLMSLTNGELPPDGFVEAPEKLTWDAAPIFAATFAELKTDPDRLAEMLAHWPLYVGFIPSLLEYDLTTATTPVVDAAFRPRDLMMYDYVTETDHDAAIERWLLTALEHVSFRRLLEEGYSCSSRYSQMGVPYYDCETFYGAVQARFIASGADASAFEAGDALPLDRAWPTLPPEQRQWFAETFHEAGEDQLLELALQLSGRNLSILPDTAFGITVESIDYFERPEHRVLLLIAAAEQASRGGGSYSDEFSAFGRHAAALLSHDDLPVPKLMEVMGALDPLEKLPSEVRASVERLAKSEDAQLAGAAKRLLEKL